MYFGLKKIADIKADGREEFYITDHLGTVNAVLDKDAATIQQYAFDPYGNIEYAQGRSDNRYLFTGKEYDAESGVFYFGARYYDSKAGRWLGRDPKEEFFSSYVYAANNPLLYIDPNGEAVKAIYYISTHQIVVSDLNTGKTFSTTAVFSGHGRGLNNPSFHKVSHSGPIPPGTYMIGKSYIPKSHEGDVDGNYNWYRLLQQDENGDWTYNKVGSSSTARGYFNLHVGLISDGCITLQSEIDREENDYPQSNEYDELRNILDNTSTVKIGEKSFLGMKYGGEEYLGSLEVKE